VLTREKDSQQKKASSRKEADMAAKKTKQTVSHADVERAIRKFREEGGLIQRLPDELVAHRSLVGSRFGMYESVMEVTQGSVATDSGAST
jgi:hypothetical protein